MIGESWKGIARELDSSARGKNEGLGDERGGGGRCGGERWGESNTHAGFARSFSWALLRRKLEAIYS